MSISVLIPGSWQSHDHLPFGDLSSMVRTEEIWFLSKQVLRRDYHRRFLRIWRRWLEKSSGLAIVPMISGSVLLSNYAVKETGVSMRLFKCWELMALNSHPLFIVQHFGFKSSTPKLCAYSTLPFSRQ